MVVINNQLQESDTNVWSVLTLTFAKSVKRKLNTNTISWKWKNLKTFNLKPKKHLNVFTRLEKSSSNHSKKETHLHILMKEIIHTDTEDIGKEKEDINLIVKKNLNTESKENNSNYRLFSENNQISKNSLWKILSSKAGRWFNFMLLKRISVKKSLKKKQIRKESKNSLLFMNAHKANLMKSSKPIQNLTLETLLLRWKRKVQEFTQVRTSRKCGRNLEDKEMKWVVKREKKRKTDVHIQKDEAENLMRKKVWTSLWRKNFWKTWNLYLVRRRVLNTRISLRRTKDL